MSGAALEQLQLSTAARECHSTVMDAPRIGRACSGSRHDGSGGPGGWVRLVPRLGRATYVGDGKGKMPPDPGAMNVVRLARRMV